MVSIEQRLYRAYQKVYNNGLRTTELACLRGLRSQDYRQVLLKSLIQPLNFIVFTFTTLHILLALLAQILVYQKSMKSRVAFLLLQEKNEPITRSEVKLSSFSVPSSDQNQFFCVPCLPYFLSFGI